MPELKSKREAVDVSRPAPAVPPAAPPDPSLIKCPVCGAMLDPRAVDFCPGCRYSLAPRDSEWRKSARAARRLAVYTAGFFAVSAAVIPLGDRFAAFGMLGIFLSGCLFAVGLARALGALGRMATAAEPAGAKEWMLTLGAGLMSAAGMFLGFIGIFGMARGRQLRKNGRILLPRLEPGEDWGTLPLRADIPDHLRAALAARWRENGRTEHASVAAFARLAMDLMALGAPPSLIASANRDSLDEIRHTELCFSLAKAIDGREIGPGPFPEAQDVMTVPSNRTLALAKLAVDSLIDGALHEGLSARILARLARRAEAPAARELILELAKDEGRHSAHGWDAVEWCLAVGGAPVAHALRGAAATLPEKPGTDLPFEAQSGSWESFGIQGLALEQDQYRRCLDAVVARVEALTAPAARRAELSAV